MSEVNRYEMNHKGLPEEDGNGSFILYEDYAALLKEREALAAENAYLLGEIKQHSNSTHFCEKCGEADPCINDDVCWSLNHPTPATDAFLAEVRACALEYYANLFKDTVNMDVKHNQEFHKGTLYVADQLRKGAAL